MIDPQILPLRKRSERLRILVIPSWYPTRANPLVGSYYQEQVVLLEKRHDMRVLYGITHPVGYRSVLKLRWFPRRGCARVLPLKEGTIPGPPLATAFKFVHRSTNEASSFEAATDGYRQMFGRLVAEGWKPDLVHAHCVDVAGIIVAKLATEFRIPWVLTEHQTFVLANYSEHRRCLMMEALRAATTVVAVSHHQMRCIAMHGIDRPMTVLGNLIDEQIFRLAESRRESARFRILSVTYPSLYKDCETFFRAVALLLNRGHTDIEVVVIGNNSAHNLSAANTEHFQDLAVKHGVKGVCQFIAHADRKDMPEQYAQCDVFVSTSIAETFGIAVREAMAVGRPVVCTASGGVEDDLSPVNGVKVNIRDAEGVADALIAIKTGRLHFDPAKVRESVVSKYGREAFLNQMSSVYENAITNCAD